MRDQRRDPLPNVTFTGQVPYAELRSLIAHCGFGFLYMKPDLDANRISSQKVVQFLAQGKPFFCSWLSEYEDHPELERRRHMIRLWLQIPQWPALPERQTVHTAEDRDLWSRFRTPRMELPSHFFADVERRRAAAVA